MCASNSIMWTRGAMPIPLNMLNFEVRFSNVGLVVPTLVILPGAPEWSLNCD
jgi:hypothetical protein